VPKGKLESVAFRAALKKINVFQSTSVRSFDNSIVMFNVSADGVTEVSMLKRYAYAETRVVSTRVSAGNTLTMHGQKSADLAPLGAPDEWEQWNLDRDEGAQGGCSEYKAG